MKKHEEQSIWKKDLSRIHREVPKLKSELEDLEETTDELLENKNQSIVHLIEQIKKLKKKLSSIKEELVFMKNYRNWLFNVTIYLKEELIKKTNTIINDLTTQLTTTIQMTTDLQAQLDHEKKQSQICEQQIIQKLNTDLKLNLSKPNLEQVINQIQKLICPNPIPSDDQKKKLEKELKAARQNITNLQKQLKSKTIPSPSKELEELTTIKQLELTNLEQLFPNQLEDSFRSQLLAATTYRELSQIKQKFLERNLSINYNNSPAPSRITCKERIIIYSLLGVLVVILLIIIKVKFLHRRAKINKK